MKDCIEEEIECDRLLSIIAKTKNSQISGQRGCEPHHIIRRFNTLFKHDLRNIAFVTREEHIKMHRELGYEKEHLTLQQLQFKQENNKTFLKDFLLKNGMSEIEFFYNRKIELLKLVPNAYDLFLLNKEINGLPTYFNKKQDCFNDFTKKVELRQVKKKSKKLELAKELRHSAYLKAKEYKSNLKLQTK